MRRDEASGGVPILLVGVSNPDTAEELVHLAAGIRSAAPFQILLTHVVKVANQISLTTGQSSPEVVRARDLLGDVVAAARRDGIATRALVEVARNVEEGLLAAAVSHDADMILVGYSEQEGEEEDGSDEKHFDRSMHRVARKASADVVVAKFRRKERRRIAVPLTVRAPLRLTGLLCRALAEHEGAEVTFLHVADADEGRARIRRELSGRLEDAGLARLGTLEIIGSEDPMHAIVETVAGHDLVILGPSGRPGLLERIFSGRARKIAESVDASVLLAWGGAEEEGA